ncbi:MAG: phosphoribosylglycinamide formyltransferase [Spirochaetaceae bacterium]|nr:phosphoribosylglycinamide formyltransferase [Spirochaetaceae bacterium]
MTGPEQHGAPKRIVLLASGSGSTLQALLDAAADPAYGVVIAAVGSDRPTAGAIDRARAAGVPTFVAPVGSDRDAWDVGLADRVDSYAPDLVVSAGFMRLAGPAFLARFAGRFLNSHPALLPSFPGMHGVRDALEYGVRLAGCTLFVVDGGVDTGPVIAQVGVPVLDDDDESTLHERIKDAERAMLVDTVGRMLREGYRVTGRKVTVP